MGSFSEAVQRDDETRTRDQGRCIVGRLQDQMDDEADRELFRSLLAEPANVVSHVWLIRRIADAGIDPPSHISMRRHRKGECLCEGFHRSFDYQRKRRGDSDG